MFWNDLSALPSPVAYFSHTCGGRIGTVCMLESTTAEGLSYVITSVVASGAVTEATCEKAPEKFAVGPFPYLMIVL